MALSGFLSDLSASSLVISSRLLEADFFLDAESSFKSSKPARAVRQLIVKAKRKRVRFIKARMANAAVTINSILPDMPVLIAADGERTEPQHERSRLSISAGSL